MASYELFEHRDRYDPKIIYAKSCLNPMFITAGVAMCFVITYHLSRFIKLPHPIKAISNGLFFGVFVFLSEIGYGILNDLFACRNNLEYFKYGHNEGQDGGLLKEQINDPNVHAFAWGFAATFPLALVAGIMFEISAFGCSLAGKQFSPYFIIILSMGVIACAAAGHIFSLIKMHNRKNDSRFNEDYYDEAL